MGNRDRYLLVILVVENPEDRQEEVQDIQIQGNSGRNLLFDMIMANNQLRVDEDISGEDQGTHTTIDQLDGGATREKRSHEAKQHEKPQRPEEIRHPVREVILGLARKERQRDEETQCEHEGLHDDARVVERSHHADGVCFHDSESGEEEEVRRVRFALPVGDQHRAQGSKHRQHQQPEVRLDPCAVAIAEERDRAHHCCQEELNSSELSALFPVYSIV